MRVVEAQPAVAIWFSRNYRTLPPYVKHAIYAGFKGDPPTVYCGLREGEDPLYTML